MPEEGIAFPALTDLAGSKLVNFVCTTVADFIGRCLEAANTNNVKWSTLCGRHARGKRGAGSIRLPDGHSASNGDETKDSRPDPRTNKHRTRQHRAYGEDHHESSLSTVERKQKVNSGMDGRPTKGAGPTICNSRT